MTSEKNNDTTKAKFDTTGFKVEVGKRLEVARRAGILLP